MKYSGDVLGRTLLQAILVVIPLLLPLGASGQNVDAGKLLFGTYCETCHGENGDGNGPAAAAFMLKPRDFALAAYKFDTDADWKKGSDADLANVIRHGPATYGGSLLMPGWANLSDEQIRQLVAYIRSLER